MGRVGHARIVSQIKRKLVRKNEHRKRIKIFLSKRQSFFYKKNHYQIHYRLCALWAVAQRFSIPLQGRCVGHRLMCPTLNWEFYKEN